jgi:N-acetylneuraminate lyase
MHSDKSLNLDPIPAFVYKLLEDGVSALFVCGSSGEGPSLTSEERMTVAESYMSAAEKRCPVIIHVGHDSVAESRRLAAHADRIGADAIAAVAPTYYDINSIDILIPTLAEIAGAAPDLPLFYYHIPVISRVDFDMLDFLNRCEKELPSLAGIKYTKLSLYEFQACTEYQNGKYTMLFGKDEMLLSALAVGARGAVGSTYNFAAPLYRRIIKAFNLGQLEEARMLQSRAVEMVRILCQFRGFPAFKGVMRLLGHDFGPARLPLVTLSEKELSEMERALKACGFFEWGL